ncbi:major facilitator superfamily domain-containing protein [Mycena belliarum]|uniref:Major facilitator superfamily domain-containing protein n=1 Tax=Mycena belliarum TaxID=1033014 RepID=A0AAD6UGR1_9AGAR|nr:major facilitator superfamily domain-containing protein [Mycena belliae]
MSSSPLPETPGTVTPGSAHPRTAQIELTDQSNRLPFKKLLPIFLGLALCVVVSTLDSVIVATALPTISSAFNAGSVVSWVPSAYLLTSTCFQPLYGRFSDIFGRKSALCLAMSLFMLGNLISGFAKTIVQLIVFRGFAGAGGGGLVSMMQIVVSDIVSLRERGKYQGIIGGVVAIGYAIGPVIGGALSQKVGWHWCFWVTIPVSFVATCVVVFILPLKPVEGNIRSKLLAVDYIGTLLTLSACTLLMLPLIWGGVTFPWKSSIVLAPLLSGFVMCGIFCMWEWKGARLPIVPMYIFKHQTVTGVFIAMFINGFVFFSTLYYLPQFFQVALGYDPLHAGLFLVPLLVSQILASWIAGMLVSRTGRYRTIIHVGFAVWSIACGCISTIRPGSSKAVQVVYMLLAGIGAGQTMQTTTVAVQASVSRRDMSVVTAMRNFLRLLGGTLSLAVASTLLNNKLRTAMTALGVAPADIIRIIDDPSLLHTPARANVSPTVATAILYHGYTKGFSALFILNAALTVFATLVSVVMIKHKELSRGEDEMLRQRALREGLEKKMGKSGAATPAGTGGATTPSALETAAPQSGDLEMSELEKGSKGGAV